MTGSRGSSSGSLANLFQPFGVITSAHFATSGNPGRCQRSGYVDMVREDGELAVSKLREEITDGILLRVK
jgi:hypothetical protein